MAIAVFAVGSLVMLALSFALGRAALLDSELLRTQISQKLADWTGGTVRLLGPITVSYLPSMTLEVERVTVVNADRVPTFKAMESKGLRIELDLWSLISGNLQVDRVHLTEPRLEFAASPKETPTDRAELVVETLRTSPFGQLSIERGAADFVNENGKKQFTAISIEVALADNGSMSGQGTFSWRGQPVEFTLESDAPKIVANSAKSQVDLIVAGPMIAGRIQGEATITDDAQIAGTLEVQVPHLRNFVNWIGLLVPEGHGLNRFTATGSVNWADQKIAVDNGRFELDGNRASGALALQYATPRPALEGTLALTDLHLSQYLAPPSKSADVKSTPSAGKSLTFPLLHHFDADLRLSASELKAKPISIGETALTLTLKSGVLAAEFAIFDMCGGTGSGRMELDAGKNRPRMQLAADFDKLTPETCIELFIPDSPITSSSTALSLALSSEGSTTRELIEKVDGELSIKMQTGKLSIDPLKVITAARKRTLRGWQSVLGNSRNFETLTASFELGDGNAKSDKLEVVSGRTTVTGRGTIDIATRKLQWRFNVANAALGRVPRFGNIVAELVDSLIIQGPLTEPTFRLEQKQASNGMARPANRAEPLMLGKMH